MGALAVLAVGCVIMANVPEESVPSWLSGAKKAADDVADEAVKVLEYGPTVLVEDIGQGLMDEIQTPEGIAAVAGETIGGMTGGIAGAKVKTKIKAKVNDTVERPSWRQSEKDVAKDYPKYNEQVSYLDGQEVPYGTKGSVRPDLYKKGHSIDVKNYNIQNPKGRKNLARNIEKQYYQRVENLPKGTKQSVVIDIRGQNVSKADLKLLYKDIMKRTNNGIKIRFKKN